MLLVRVGIEKNATRKHVNFGGWCFDGVGAKDTLHVNCLVGFDPRMMSVSVTVLRNTFCVGLYAFVRGFRRCGGRNTCSRVFESL